MNVIFTCGGTAGHISPALAVANLLKERHPEANILFVGAEDGMAFGWKRCGSPIFSGS